MVKLTTPTSFPISVWYKYVDGNLPTRYVYTLHNVAVDPDTGGDMIGSDVATIDLDPSVVVDNATLREWDSTYVTNLLQTNVFDLNNTVILSSSVTTIPTGTFILTLKLYYPTTTITLLNSVQAWDYSQQRIRVNQLPIVYKKSSVPFDISIPIVNPPITNAYMDLLSLTTSQDYKIILDFSYILKTCPLKDTYPWPAIYSTDIIDFTNILSNPIVNSSSVSSVPDDSYLIGLRFETYQNPYRFEGQLTLTLDGVTKPIILISPTPTRNFFNRKIVLVEFQTTERSDPNSFVIDLINQDTNQIISIYLTASQAAGFTNNAYFNIDDISNTYAGNSTLRSVTQNTIPEGTYTLRVSYQDYAGNKPATAELQDVFIDSIINPPQILGWVDNGIYTNPVRLYYQLPEPTVRTIILFTEVLRGNILKRLSMVTDQIVDYRWDRASQVQLPNPPFLSSPSANMYEGLFDIELIYVDRGNNEASSIVRSVRFKMMTANPTINSIGISQDIEINFVLPDIAQNGQYTINIYDQLKQIYTTVGQTNLTEPYKTNITAYDGVREVLSYYDNINRKITIPLTSIPFSSGTHRIELIYRDYLGNTPASTSQNIIIPSAITAPQAEFSLSNDMINCAIKLADETFLYASNFTITFKNLTEGLESTFSYPSYPLLSMFSVNVNNPSSSLDYVSGYEKQLLEGQYEIIITLTLASIGVTQSFSHPFEFSYSALGPIIKLTSNVFSSTKVLIPFTVQTIPLDNQTTVTMTGRESGDLKQVVVTTEDIGLYQAEFDLVADEYLVQVMYNTDLGKCQDSIIITVGYAITTAPYVDI